MPIWAVVNQKGGVGKTTTAVNIAACLSLLGKKTLLIDADPQGNSTTGLGVEKSSLNLTIYEVLTECTPIKQAIVPTKLKDLDVLPATLDLAGAEPALLGRVGRETVLKEAVEEIRNDYDWIFIDAPPSLGILTLNALAASDAALIPMQCEFYALEGLTQLLQTFELIKKRIHPELKVGKVLLTMYDKRNRLSLQVEEEVRGYFGDVVARTTIPRNVRLSEAPGFGEPAVIRYPQSLGAKAYMEFAKEVMENA